MHSAAFPCRSERDAPFSAITRKSQVQRPLLSSESMSVPTGKTGRHSFEISFNPWWRPPYSYHPPPPQQQINKISLNTYIIVISRVESWNWLFFSSNRYILTALLLSFVCVFFTWVSPRHHWIIKHLILHVDLYCMFHWLTACPWSWWWCLVF